MDKNLKKIKIAFWIFFSLSTLINIFIIFQSCLPASSSMKWSNVFVDMINNISHSTGGGDVSRVGNMSISDFIRKSIGHFFIFLMDGVFTFLMFYFLFKFKMVKYAKFTAILTLLTGLLVACISEFIQYFVPTRAGLIADVGIDALGFVIGGVVTYLTSLLIIHHRNKKLVINE